MKAIIIEDEKPAAEKLQKALRKTEMGVEIVAILGSVRETVNWLHEIQMPDFLFMEMELGVGLSFRIFEKVQITSPVIFCTAFDEYWQEAFEQNSIDYLLKPVKQEKLEAALNKYEKLKQYFTTNLRQLQQWREQPASGYKKRFLVKRGTDYISIRTEDIAYFYATHKLVCIVDKQARKFILDQSLADIEKQVDPVSFFRVNRKFLLQLDAIKKIKSFPKSKLILEVFPECDEEIIISQENVTAFKEWMNN